jgi:microcystin-dependent protein
MSEPFIGEIRIFSFNFAPRGWALCNGQLLPINQNQALFSILGTTYGGNGQTTFALPNLMGRTPLHTGGDFSLGASGGEEAHALLAGEMPGHTHAAFGSGNSADQASPQGGMWAVAPQTSYNTGSDGSQMNAAAIGTAGASQPHDNMSPFLVLNCCIALMGIYPSRN